MCENLKTPYFLLHTKIVDGLVESIQNAVREYWKDGIVGYSFKTNNLPWIISHMKEKGLWAEVVSSDEYNLARELGYSYDKIVFNGPAKGKKEFIDAVTNGAVVNIDSKRELDWLHEIENIDKNRSKIGLRVNFCLEDFCPGESQCGIEDGRFGFSYEKGELLEAINFLRNNNITLSGLHLHCSSKTRSLNIYKAICDITVKIVRKYNLSLEYIDIGGGFFGGVVGKPDFKEYMSLIYSIFSKKKYLNNTNIIVEPGMSIIGAGIDYVTSVIDIKTTKNSNFVLLDGSRIHIDPLMRKKSYSYHIDNLDGKIKRGKVNKDQILCGFTCMEGDRFFKLKNEQINLGDKIVFEKVGAYTMGLSPQFIEFYPAVFAKIDSQIILIRKKHTAKDFLLSEKCDNI